MATGVAKPIAFSLKGIILQTGYDLYFGEGKIE